MRIKLQKNQAHRYFLWGIVSLIMGVSSSHAQNAASYAFSTNATSSLALDRNANAIDLSTGSTQLVAAGLDDTRSTLTNIGFTFNFQGTPFTTFSTSDNGIIRLGGLIGTADYTLSGSNSLIAPFGNDLQVGGNGVVRSKVFGSAPNRVLVIEHFNIQVRYTGNSATAGTGTWQTRLYETSDIIEFVYGAMTTTASGPTTLYIGISKGVTSNNFLTVNYNTQTANFTTPLATNTYASNSTITQLNSSSNGSRRAYTFMPPQPCSGVPGAGIATLNSIPACGTGNYSLGISGAINLTGVSYQWQSSFDNVNFTDMLYDTLAGLTKPVLSSVMYFRRNVTCISSGILSNSVSVMVKPVYAGTASSTTAVCGDSITLTLANQSASISGLQWESSGDSLSWFSIFGGTTTPLKVPSPTSVTYYRAVVTCAATSSTDNSVPVKVNAVAGGVVSVLANICSDSTILGVNGSSTGASLTYQWETSPDSLVWSPVLSATGITYKFPAPAVATFYRRVTTCGGSSEASAGMKVSSPCGGFGYSITRSTGITYTSIQPTGNTFTWVNNSGDDDRSAPIYFPAGFNFTYNGIVRPAFTVCTNGWLTFDTTSTSTAYDNAATAPNLLIGPFFEDLVTLGGLAANLPYIKYQLSGIAPNRVMTVEWAEMERYNYGSPNLNFQVKFYEGTNNIEYVYGKMQAFDGSNTGEFTYTLGMYGNVPANGQKLLLLLENTSNFSPITGNDQLAMVPLCNTSLLFTAGGTFNRTYTSNVPVNDSSSTPVVLTVNALPCADACGTYYTSKGATASNLGVTPLSTIPDDDVWFKFTAPLSGQVNISTFSSSGYNPAFQVMTTSFDSAGLGSAWLRDANSNAVEAAVATGLTPFTDYLIRVYNSGSGSGSTSGSFSICINEVIPAPANDDTTGAVVLTAGTTCSPVAGTTLGATASPQAVCGGLADDDVWYKFTPSSATDTIKVDGSGTFRAHVQVLNKQLVSLYCQNTNANAGDVSITATGLMKDSTYFIRVYHTNAGTASANFTICVSGITATLPSLITGTNTNITLSSVTGSGNISSDGGFPITRSGVLVSMFANPTIGSPSVTDSATNPLVTNGAYSVNFTGLSPASTYYARAYAINSMGVAYGADSSFFTPASASVATVTRIPASNIAAYTATIGGNISSDGGSAILASGIIYSTSRNPFLLGIGVVDSTTSPVVTSGNFSKNIAGLLANTKYYYKAYATNSVGTAYSLEDSFTSAPIVSLIPYTENFDLAGNTGWTSQATGGVDNWVLGTPAKTRLNGAYSAPNAWVTKLTGNYDNAVDAAVVSPQFDFTSQTADPILRFRHKFSMISGIDGAVVEISLNGGNTWSQLDNVVGTGGNFNTTGSTAWYNNAANGFWTPTIGANFSGLSSGYSSNASGWIQSVVTLTGAAGQGNVKVRLRVATTSYTFFGTDEGWEVDNIEVIPPTVATLTTDGKSNITFAGATLAGTILNNGYSAITASGIVVGTSPAPTRGAMGVADSATNPLITTGSYSLNFAGLSASTTYYYRAYAVNAIGTAYGADNTFTTNASAVAPYISNTTARNYTTSSVSLGGNITSDGGAAITASGVVYSTTSNPVLLGVGVVDSTTNPLVTSGVYSVNPAGLTPGTKYYFRAYATNAVGTTYGANDSFLTDAIITSMPYNQDFETSMNTGWKANSLSGAANQWVLTTPSKAYLNAAHSGVKAWVTKAVGVYDDGVDNELVSPQFNFTGVAEDPILRFSHKFVTEPGYDAMVVEISIDNGAWTPLDNTGGAGDNFNTLTSYSWHNSNSTNGPIAPDKFSSINANEGSDLIYSSQVSGWIESATRLTGAAGQDTVRFRFRFGSDVSGGNDGWALDDIVVTGVTAPTTAASAVTVTPANTTANVSWTNGNGAGRIVVARLTTTLAVAPTNYNLYEANAAYSTGATTGTGNYVVYNGTGSSVNVTGLTTATNYTFDVYEFNGKYMHVKFGSRTSGNTTTTPVKLVSFAATNNSGSGYLTWATSSEKNNAGFNVERSTDGKSFEYVAFVKGATNSNSLLRYAYSDANVFKATGARKVYYRLKQMDRDGRFDYSNVVSISDEEAGSFAVKAYPVPFVKDVTLAVTANNQSSATVSVMDIQGRVISTQAIEVVEGENTITLSTLNDLTAGVYFVKVVQQGNTQTVRVVKAN